MLQADREEGFCFTFLAIEGGLLGTVVLDVTGFLHRNFIRFVSIISLFEFIVSVWCLIQHN